jgi:hypothetical protein
VNEPYYTHLQLRDGASQVMTSVSYTTWVVAHMALPVITALKQVQRSRLFIVQAAARRNWQPFHKARITMVNRCLGSNCRCFPPLSQHRVCRTGSIAWQRLYFVYPQLCTGSCHCHCCAKPQNSLISDSRMRNASAGSHRSRFSNQLLVFGTSVTPASLRPGQIAW